MCTCSTQTCWAILTLGNQQQIPNVHIFTFTAHICTCTHRGACTHTHTPHWVSSGCQRVSTTYPRIWGLPRWHYDKEPACHCRRHKRHRFSPWVGKIPWRRKWQPTPVFLFGESPWTEQLGGLQSMGSQRVGQDWIQWPACLTPLDKGLSGEAWKNQLRPH